ncbi:UNVERIFIED_CONTAM: hypothetical protein Sradi_3143500 [Sesamum radiatum]|uniref:Uncharacterized protein n=1 Tax=Sesamum radiatum TaxID=300843 RepID=A0AAW2RDY2_SESRA
MASSNPRCQQPPRITSAGGGQREPEGTPLRLGLLAGEGSPKAKRTPIKALLATNKDKSSLILTNFHKILGSGNRPPADGGTPL